jgi:hypothetical protein
MKHVFVETNWVVDWAGPAHHQVPAAVELYTRAGHGDVTLHIPSVCIHEARHPINRRKPRHEADAIRSFLPFAIDRGLVTTTQADDMRVVLNKFEAAVSGELGAISQRLTDLRVAPGVDVFALDDEMLERAMVLTTLDLDLQPFDQAILAAILVRAERLVATGVDRLVFCELDSNLQPWDKAGNAKRVLAGLYDAARVDVQGNWIVTG